MTKKDLQISIGKICDDFGLSKKVVLVDNLLDVPSELQNLNMLINALKNIKDIYQEDNKTFLEAYRHFSYKHRKGLISSEQFQSKFEEYKASKKQFNSNLILS